jgi:hypothetical protein
MRAVLVPVILVVVLFVSIIVDGAPATAQSNESASPVAALVFVTDDSRVTVHIDLGDAGAMMQQWEVASEVTLRTLPDSPLPTLVRALQLNGEPTPQPVPTLTPYVRRESVPFMIGERTTDSAAVVIPADVSSSGHRFVELTCATCASGWEQLILAQLPDRAPIVVVAPTVAQIDGAWRIKAQPVNMSGELADDAEARATLFVRQKDRPVGGVELTEMRQIADTPFVQFNYVDGRPRLLRVVLCLVVVLFMSVSSFYLSIAVMRRMHAAVGYNPNEGK